MRDKFVTGVSKLTPNSETRVSCSTVSNAAQEICIEILI